MFIKPMPKQLLIHSVKYEKYLGEDDWSGGENYGDPVTIDLVRVQWSTDLNRNNNATDVFYQAMMFYDMTHSKPKNIEWVENSKITIDGQTMYIKEVHPIYTTKLHHYELMLT
ncbi:putative minor capsid protein [Salipaludibacillus aurantiacus]|uniref:Minor capsid protein n=1 Tax=Salipaludibacillus aurantiacus TaxID=1601833 RepID=A0A1H9U0J9_9BACI|nr:putative minor capsid protein [Salipaludibacillus aurantiacus]SES02697.1 Minor capsid protein [Salipaludibacillus aurantiacus]